MRIEELDYVLPPGLIADRPAEPRETCRLMVVHREKGEIEHRQFTDLHSYLTNGDLLALNSARVTPARLFAHVDGDSTKPLEILVIDASASSRCHALVYPSRKVQPGFSLISLKTETSIRVMGIDDGQWQLELEKSAAGWRDLLEWEGHMPLPPYILKRRPSRSDQPEDRVWYQTTYADRDGAIAAPTAGLHFSKDMLEHVEKDGIDIARIFLKVGIGTFQPIHAKTVEKHLLAPEEYEVSNEAAGKINATRLRRKRVIAVGTTVVRTLEFCASEDGTIKPGTGATRLLIMPSHSFRGVDGLITNFHLPRTTLLALVYAFGGTELIRHAYATAIKERYRFFSYGDAMLIL